MWGYETFPQDGYILRMHIFQLVPASLKLRFCCKDNTTGLEFVIYGFRRIYFLSNIVKI